MPSSSATSFDGSSGSRRLCKRRPHPALQLERAICWISKKGLLEGLELLVKQVAISSYGAGCGRRLRWRLDPLLPSKLAALELGIDHPSDLLGFAQSIPVVLKAQAESLHRSLAGLFTPR